jgi:hypothetical protein
MHPGAGEHSRVQREGNSIFPREAVNQLPLLSLEEERQLNDMPLLEN